MSKNYSSEALCLAEESLKKSQLRDNKRALESSDGLYFVGLI